MTRTMNKPKVGGRRGGGGASSRRRQPPSNGRRARINNKRGQGKMVGRATTPAKLKQSWVGKGQPQAATSAHKWGNTAQPQKADREQGKTSSRATPPAKHKLGVAHPTRTGGWPIRPGQEQRAGAPHARGRLVRSSRRSNQCNRNKTKTVDHDHTEPTPEQADGEAVKTTAKQRSKPSIEPSLAQRTPTQKRRPRGRTHNHNTRQALSTTQLYQRAGCWVQSLR